MVSLLDLGEREILRKIIPRYASAAGDDCASMAISEGNLIITTDPVPPPAAFVIGGDNDPFWMGWLLVTINVSDLAAAGAVPLGFVAAIECEAERSTESFERLLFGIKSCCAEASISYVGGNLREAQKLAAVGTAFGVCEGYPSIGRRGARDGDLVVSVGQGGLFWRDALRIMRGNEIESKDASVLFKPCSQIHLMHRLAAKGLINAAMDNSDGLLPSLNEIAAKNGIGLVLNLDALHVPDLREDEGVEAARCWMGWGDWNIIACVSPDKWKEVQRIASDLGTAVCAIGQLTSEYSGVRLRRDGVIVLAPRLESERFARDSWMSLGIQEYVRMLKNLELP